MATKVDQIQDKAKEAKAKAPNDVSVPDLRATVETLADAVIALTERIKKEEARNERR